MNDNKIHELHIRAKNALDNLKCESLQPEDDLKMLEFGCHTLERVTEFVTHCLQRVANKMRQHDENDEVNR